MQFGGLLPSLRRKRLPPSSE